VKRYFLSALVMMCPLALQADITFTQLAQISTTPENLQGRFSQEKYLAALDVSLMSTGVFTYQRGKSIRWEILEPIQNELVITPSTIINQQGNDELLRLDMDTNPTAAVMGKVFFSVLTAEWAQLSDYFELSGEIEGQQWRAVLVPVDQTIIQMFSRIELEGGSLLRVIILQENSGDRTTIRLDIQG